MRIKTISKSILLMSVFTLLLFAEKQDITLKKVIKDGTFSVKGIYGLKSMADGAHYTSLKDGKTMLAKYEYATGEAVDTLLNLADIDNDDIKSIYDYELSEDEQKILFYTNRKRIYRHSFYADHYIYDTQTEKLISLTDKDHQRVAKISPDGSKVAFVFENNMYIKNLASGKEKQITFDGVYNKIQNGTPDWVYEEEFSFFLAYQWSPDSKKIAFLKSDEEQIKTFNMTKFRGTHPDLKENELYPENYTFKYPKAGEKNSIVTVHVYDLENGKTKQMKTGKETDQYIPRIKWLPNSEKLAILRLNRLQYHLEILLATPKNGKSKVIYEDKETEYVEDGTFDSFTILGDNEHFIIQNEKSGFNHLYLYDFKGKTEKALTNGEFEVKRYYGYNEKSQKLFFTMVDGSPINTALYSVDINGENFQKLSTQTGVNSAKFSSSFKYYINTFESATTPDYITLNDADGKVIRVLEDNQALLDTLENYNFSPKEFFSYKNSEGVELNCWMLKPVNFDSNKKYPVIIDQYSGPGSQSVKNDWSCDWYQSLIAQGYIVVAVDTRGTGARGEAFKKITYKQLGKYESIDLVETGKYLKTLDYIDPERVGIWGWSYGGYTTLLALETGEGTFNMGISVAPVTDYKYYDTIWTERFNSTPQDNPEGYKAWSALERAKDLQGKLLIVHGTADDNVHAQNTYEFIEQLVQNEIQFDMMMYTNRNHSIYGGNTRYHLFTKITNYILENL